MEKIMKIYKGLILYNRVFWMIMLIALIGILSNQRGYADQEHFEQLPNIVETEQAVQTTCPVLVGNKINPDIYTDYKGKRIYFCCNSCKADFERNPGKYVSNLPQFASARESGHNHTSQEHGGGLLILARLIVPMGIITLSLVVITVILVVFRRINVHLMMKWHKRIGIAALISGAIHAIFVLFAH